MRVRSIRILNGVQRLQCRNKVRGWSSGYTLQNYGESSGPLAPSVASQICTTAVQPFVV